MTDEAWEQTQGDVIAGSSRAPAHASDECAVAAVGLEARQFDVVAQDGIDDAAAAGFPLLQAAAAPR